MTTIQELVSKMRESDYIKERRFGNISSFNFTKAAFYDQRWNSTTTKARGLFVDTKEDRVVARGYDKFFNFGENSITSPAALKNNLKFPLRVFRKENGYLGLISWDKEKDDFLFCSKSFCNEGPYAEKLKEIFYSSGINLQAAKDLTKSVGVTIIVEVIDPVFDPHIIEYKERQLILLDLMYNGLSGATVPFFFARNFWSKLLNIKMKEFCGYIEDWQDMVEAIEKVTAEDYREDGQPVEGYVFQDTSGFMFKVKSGYYYKWKKYRKLAQGVLQGSLAGSAVDSDRFLSWVKAHSEEIKDASIIDMRNRYEAEDEHKV